MSYFMFADENSTSSTAMRSAEGMEFFVIRNWRKDGKAIYHAKTADGEILCSPVAGLDVINYICDRIINEGLHYMTAKDDDEKALESVTNSIAVIGAVVNDLNNARQILSTVRRYSGVWASEHQRLAWSLEAAVNKLSELVK